MSTTKKPVRRGRQKKDILDEEDLQKHEQLQKALQQGKNKQNQNDMFDTAKLDKNYFIRNQNKSSNHESQVFNFDDESQIPGKSTKQQTQKQQTQKQQKSTNKKRDYRRRKKNQNIFDQQDQNYLEVHSEIKSQATDSKLLNRNQQKQSKNYYRQQQTEQQKPHTKIQGRKLQFPPQVPNFKKQQSSLGHKQQQVQPQNKNVISGSQQQDNQDDFNNVIKQKEEQSDDQQKVFILHKEIQKISKQNRKEFYYRTLPPKHVAYGYFKRFSSGLSQIYQLCGQDHRPLLFCQNQRGCIGANYYISMTKQMDKNNPTYLGKLRGNASGSVYYLYDDGVQPKNQMNRSDWRVSMAAIEYQNNFMGMNGPRKIRVTAPSAKLLQDADTFKLSQQESLVNFQPPIITRFRNKTPKWNQRLRSYALNFGGRVKLASIKNFILIDNQFKIQDEDEADNIIVFGKVNQNTFSLQYRYPLSLYQAFGIVMSEFDFKINCQ